MSAPADKQAHGGDVAPDGVLSQMQAQINNLVAAMRIVTTKLDADAGVTDTNYFALSCDSAVSTAPAKITSI